MFAVAIIKDIIRRYINETAKSITIGNSRILEHLVIKLLILSSPSVSNIAERNCKENFNINSSIIGDIIVIAIIISPATPMAFLISTELRTIKSNPSLK